MRFELRKADGWSYFYVPEFEQKGMVHGFFTGLSPSTLSEGGDRKRFLDLFSLKDLVIMNQEHGDEVHLVKAGERPLSGDGIIVAERGVAGIIKTADCLPVILMEPDFPMAAVVHAGWRGTAKRITARTVRLMKEAGAKGQRITALLGPSIGPCCYEIQEDVFRRFRDEGFSERVVRHDGDALFLDIREANREALQGEGVNDLYDIGLCTYCSREYLHSYRRGDRDKRQISFVSLL
jgi:YfiH family protein